MTTLSQETVQETTQRVFAPPSLQALIRAFQEMNNQDDFGILSSMVLTIATDLFQAQAATLLLTNRMTGDLEIAAVKQVPEEFVTAYMQHPERAGTLSDFYRGGVPPEQIPQHAPLLAQLAGADYPWCGILPITIRGKIIGYLTLADEVSLLLDEATREKMDLFIEYIAQGIENAYFIFQLKQQNTRLERMMTKLQNTQNHLKRTEKMALVGKIAATVAHEIRNPLTIIGTNLQLVFDKMEAGHPEQSLYESMINKVRNVDHTIKELMVFARPLQLLPKRLVLEKTLDRVITFVEKKYQTRELCIIKQIPADMPEVFLDEEQTQRIFINLLLNAYQFLPVQGSVTIQAGYRPGDSWVSMMVADTGSGIAPEHLQQVFEPYFTTRTEGNGLGLFMVKHLLEEMNGTIEVRSEPQSGAKFILHLPIAR
ncbi:hypothetical protein K8S19_07010 [bacterium]|nr:hypothetical protein [bacterium]